MTSRQERRKSEREKLKNFEKNPPEYQKERERELVVDFLALCMQVLHDNFSFGDKRLKRFGKAVDEQLDCINAGYVTFADIVENLSMKEK